MDRQPRFERVLVAADFAPYVGTALRVDAVPAPVEIQLDRILRHAPLPVALREPFTLVFSTPFSVLLVAGTYGMRTRDGMVVEVDVIPTQTAPGPRRNYHAVFA